MKFDPMHDIEVRPPHDVKQRGGADKPYIISWGYPVYTNRQFTSSNRRHNTVTTSEALTFALKHQIPMDRLPVSVREQLCELARYVKTLA